MSLLMLLNKIQRPDDFQTFQHLSLQNVDAIMKESPGSVVDIIAKTVSSLCRKLNVPKEETDDYISKIRKERKMGYLFENMEKMDIQLERRLRKEAELKAQKAEENERKAEENAKKIIENAKKVEENAKRVIKNSEETRMQFYIEALQDISYDSETILALLKKKFNLDDKEAECLLQRYWTHK